jgi:DNA replication and repair protein RecF
VKLTRLRLFHYRNIDKLEIFPSGGTNLFSGLNGHGKTNLLESIYLLAYGKSFRTANPKDCIQHGQTECRVEGTIEIGTLTRDLSVTINASEKKLFLLGKPVALDEFAGNLHVLAFTREHLNVVRGAPSDRRAFLDRAMVTLYPGHLHALAVYGRSLKQRNSFLSCTREGRSRPDENILDSWDETIVRPGARIIWNRMRYVERMKQELPQGLFGSETVTMHYVSSIGGEAADVPRIEELFRQKLRAARSRDQRTGHTSVGPHRDDLKLFVNGKSLIDYGSSGQQRSCLISMYFSQMEIHRINHGFYPVFLVDDAEAELDMPRIDLFIALLSQKTQAFFTSAKDFLFSGIPGNTSRFEVRNGAIFPASNATPQN